MALRLRWLVSAVCPGVLLFAVLCLLVSSPLSPLWTERQLLEPELLKAHTPQATHGFAHSTRAAKHQPHSQPRRGVSVRHVGGRNLYSGSCEGDQLCFHHLLPADRKRFEQCVAKTVEFNVSRVENGSCRFISWHGRGTVALASFPGSGNTWVRGLLEMATGVCTGAFVCDASLRARGFAGENIQSGSVLVVKTHRWAPWWTGEPKPEGLENPHKEASYTAAIVLLRNPFNALVAEWNREVANGFHIQTISLESHAEAAGPEWFGTNPKWEKFVHQKIQLWQSMVRSWVLHSVRKHPIVVVKYEDLKQNIVGEVKRMLDFLAFPYKERELRQRVEAGFGDFHRPPRRVDKPFPPALWNVVYSAVRNISQEAKNHRLEHTLRLEEYLTS